jgi:hypothetical protein
LVILWQRNYLFQLLKLSYTWQYHIVLPCKGTVSSITYMN